MGTLDCDRGGVAEREMKSVERFRQMIDLTEKAKGLEKRLTFKRFEKGRCTCTSLLTAAAIKKLDNDDFLTRKGEVFLSSGLYNLQDLRRVENLASPIRRTRRRGGGLLMVEAKKKKLCAT